MSKKIFTAQSVEELKFILDKVNQPVICLPLNLSTQIYCIKNEIQFYNPIDFIDNNFYKDALVESEKLMEKLSFGELKFESHIKVLKKVKGQWGRRKNTIRIARQAMEKAMQYAYRDRRNKKRDFKSLRIQRIRARVAMMKKEKKKNKMVKL